MIQIALPISPQHREMIEQAAAQSGHSLDDFAVTTLVEKAREVLQSGSMRVLSERDARRFLELLDADVEPNEAQRAAANRYSNRNG
jgi:uncharacterized protein (DUF1778 family)